MVALGSSRVLATFCDGKLYQITSTGAAGAKVTQLFRIRLDTQSYELVGTDNTNDEVNAFAYNPDDGRIYGIAWDKPNSRLVSFDSSGNFTDLGIIGNNFTLNSTAGTFVYDTAAAEYRLHVRYGPTGSTNVAVIDVQSNSRVSTYNLSGGARNNNWSDIAFNPIDGRIYALSTTLTDLYYWEPEGATAGQSTTITTDRVIHAGALFFDSTGTFYGAANSTGEVFTIDLATGVTTVVGRSATASGNDGANCLTQPIQVDYDYSDAASTYGVAQHTATPTLLRLGPTVTSETSATQDADTDDGISAFPTLTVGDTSYTIPAANISVTNTTGSNANLYAWIDFNGNGTFEAGEFASTTVANNATNPSGNLSFTPITVTQTGNFYARFRLTSATLTNADASSIAPDGEVEDLTLAMVSNIAATVTSCSPNVGPIGGGTSVTIVGSNFIGATSVTFGGISATSYTVVSTTTITVTTPANSAGPSAVTVTTPAGVGSLAACFTYRDVVSVTQRTIMRFMRARGKRLVEARSPVGLRQHSRLSGTLFGGGSTTPSANPPFALGGPGAVNVQRTGSGSGSDSSIVSFGSDTISSRSSTAIRPPFSSVPSQRAARSQSTKHLPLGVTGVGDGDRGRLSFSTSLRQYLQSKATDKRNRSSQLMALGQATITPGSVQLPKLDVWARGNYSYYKQDHVDGADKGHAGLFQAGADYVIHPGILIGAMIQLDTLGMNIDGSVASADGRGWMAGPYLTARLTDQLFFDAYALWGKSKNNVNPFGEYEDDFATRNQLYSAALTGHWNLGHWYFRPKISVLSYNDKQKAYRSSASGFGIGSQTFKLGVMKFGPEVGHTLQTGLGFTIRNFARLHGVWTFQQTEETSSTGALTSHNPFHAQLKAGVSITHSTGAQLQFSAQLSGLGDEDLLINSGTVKVTVPVMKSQNGQVLNITATANQGLGSSDAINNNARHDQTSPISGGLSYRDERSGTTIDLGAGYDPTAAKDGERGWDAKARVVVPF